MTDVAYRLVLPDSAGNPVDCTHLVRAIVDRTLHPPQYVDVLQMFFDVFGTVYLTCGESGVVVFEAHVADLQDRANGLVSNPNA